MKLLIAYVRISKRSAVGLALRDAGLSGWSESMVQGHGRAADGHAVEHVRVEVVVPDDRADEIKRIIADAAASVEGIGDGLVIGLPLDFAERI